MKRQVLKDRTNSGGSYFASAKTNLKFIPSGSKTLDLALGGGWAEGRVANVIGDSSSGKTLLCIEAAANFAKKYPSPKSRIKFRESEHAFDTPYAGALGMPLDRVDFGDPLETIEDLFEDLDEITAKAKVPTLYILDSLDGLSDRAEMKRDMDSGSYSLEKHKKLSRLFRQLIGRMSEHLTVLIVSQVRSKIGGLSYGPKVEPTGGHALKFYSSQRLMLAQIGTIVKTVSGIKRPYGIMVKGKIIKNKIGMPFRDAEFRILFGFGIDDAEACVSWLAEAKGLKDIGVSLNDIDKYLSDLRNAEDGQYVSEMNKLHAAVEKRWYSIEQSFLPTRRKY